MTGPARSEPARGLQNERTSLAWGRTALSLVGVGAVLARQADSLALSAGVLGAVAVLALWLSLRSHHHHRARHGRLIDGTPIEVRPELAVATVATVALAATGLVVLLR